MQWESGTLDEMMATILSDMLSCRIRGPLSSRRDAICVTKLAKDISFPLIQSVSVGHSTLVFIPFPKTPGIKGDWLILFHPYMQYRGVRWIATLE